MKLKGKLSFSLVILADHLLIDFILPLFFEIATTFFCTNMLHIIFHSFFEEKKKKRKKMPAF